MRRPRVGIVAVVLAMALFSLQQGATAWSVNGYVPSSTEQSYLSWLKTYTLPNLRNEDGSAVELWTRCRRLALIAWWSLKEGDISAFNVNQHAQAGYPANVFGTSICLMVPATGSAYNKVIGPTAVCVARTRTSNDGWQLGIAGIQWNDDHARSEQVALAIYRAIRNDRTITLSYVLHQTLLQAGFGTTSSVYQKVQATVGKSDAYSVDLRQSWLLRNHLVGVAMNVNNIAPCEFIPSCRGQEYNCCGNSKVACTAGAYTASSPSAIKQSIIDLHNFFCS